MNRGFKQTIKRFVPNSVVSSVVKGRTLFNVVRHFGGVHPRECPICRYKGYFFAYGQPLRMDYTCPKCRSIARHRQHYLLLQKHPEWINDKVILHFAAEPCFVADYTARAKKYLRADLEPSASEIQVDIQQINCPDDFIDTIVCHNVLEHVADDRKALSEIYRVLRPGGIALLSAPVIDAWDHTYEDPTITGFWERDRHFNQWDHVRYYGRDFRERINAPGFELTMNVAVEPDVSRYGLDRGETIFIGRKPSINGTKINAAHSHDF